MWRETMHIEGLRMTETPIVLCVEEHGFLLTIRARVIETLGVKTILAETHSEVRMAANEKLSGVIIGHGIDAARWAGIEPYIRMLHPDIPILKLEDGVTQPAELLAFAEGLKTTGPVRGTRAA
jgi:hypothetical protein